jgi:hypothetical protein
VARCHALVFRKLYAALANSLVAINLSFASVCSYGYFDAISTRVTLSSSPSGLNSFHDWTNRRQRPIGFRITRLCDELRGKLPAFGMLDSSYHLKTPGWSANEVDYEMPLNNSAGFTFRTLAKATMASRLAA